MLRNDGFHNSTSKIPLRPCCFKRLVSLMLLLILLRIWLGAFLPGYFRDPVFRPAQIYVPRTTRATFLTTPLVVLLPGLT